jgi:hypothetical protein
VLEEHASRPSLRVAMSFVAGGYLVATVLATRVRRHDPE